MRRIPSSTYRLQLHAGFTFEDAAKTADYLQALGISHVSILLSRAAWYAHNDTLSFIFDSFQQLPSPESDDHEAVMTRHRDKNVLTRDAVTGGRLRVQALLQRFLVALLERKAE